MKENIFIELKSEKFYPRNLSARALSTVSLPALPFPSSLEDQKVKTVLESLPLPPLPLLSPLPVVRTVVDSSDVLPPTDGAADVGEDGDGELVPGLQTVRHALGLCSTLYVRNMFCHQEGFPINPFR